MSRLTRSEAAKLKGVSVSTLRRWESEGKLIPERTANGHRRYTVVGIDNNMRQVFFGEDASTEWNRAKLSQDYGDKYIHHAVDIRDHEAIADIFKTNHVQPLPKSLGW